MQLGEIVRNKVLFLSLCACAAISLAGCGGSSQDAGTSSFYTGGSPGGKPVPGGTLVFDRSLEVKTFDPLMSSDNGDLWALLNIYDQLTQNLPEKRGPQPDLATSWKETSGGLSWQFTLRPNVQFSDGTPVTPQDVRFSLERLMGPENANF